MPARAAATENLPPNHGEDATGSGTRNGLAAGREAGKSTEIGIGATLAEPRMRHGKANRMTLAAVALGLAFGSLIATGLPLLAALLGFGLGIPAMFALSAAFGISAGATAAAMLIGPAIGIICTPFIAARCRAELIKGHSREEALGKAAGSAASAVVFPGLTLVVTLTSLVLGEMPMFVTIGLAAAAIVAIALFTVTLVPRSLARISHRVFGRGVHRVPLDGRRPRHALPGRSKVGPRRGRAVLQRPQVVLLTTVITLGTAAVLGSVHIPGNETHHEATSTRGSGRATAELTKNLGSGTFTPGVPSRGDGVGRQVTVTGTPTSPPNSPGTAHLARKPRSAPHGQHQIPCTAGRHPGHLGGRGLLPERWTHECAILRSWSIWPYFCSC
ncbi:MMPL family transporter [Streptomyces sp. NPDC048641]|uniref:MMPL family transporter n=1 Tax=Streptomyces sp. NPDC048641 TaxID=3154825 RepID=UPI0034431AAA